MGKDLKGKELGEGLSQRKDGLYSARFTTCVRKRREKYFKSLKEAQIWLAKEREKDGYMNLTNMTLDDWYKVWISTFKEGIVRDNTVKNYDTNYRIRIKKYLGRKRLDKITNLDCQRLMNDLFDSRKYSQGTLYQTRITLHAIFKGAVENRYIVFNPVDGVKIKKLDDKEDQDRRVLTRDEQRLLVGAMKDCMYKNAFMLVLQSGLRAGEVGALNWDDVDFENRKIYVKKTLLQAKSKGGFYFGPPKSKHSIREIPMTEEAYRVLKDQYVEQKKMMIRSSNWSDEYKGLVFTTVNGNPVGQSTFRLSLVRIVNNINLELEASGKKRMEPIYMHALRHTFATRCIENGMQPKVLQKIMGHSTLAVTMDLYVHVTDDLRVQEMKKMDVAI